MTTSAMDAVMNVEGFRALGASVLETVVNKSEAVSATRRSKGDAITTTEKKRRYAGCPQAPRSYRLDAGGFSYCSTMQVQGERARIMITVKASPQPSAKYGDTVCVAGIRIDGGRAEWIRLYPVPFRWMDGDQQFRKYDVVDVEMRRAAGDTRPESFKPNIETITVVDHLEEWKDRQPYFERLPRTTTCELSRAATARHDAPSLGMVPVGRFDSLSFKSHPGWTDGEKTKIAASVGRTPLSLFADSSRTPNPLRAPRFKVRYHYHCTEEGCPGHVGQILDWELTALQNRQRVDDDQLKMSITQRFYDQMFKAGRETSFFMGNFEDARKRHSFSVLGVHYPSSGVASSVGLFDLDADK